jgi:hypothetical protein
MYLLLIMLLLSANLMYYCYLNIINAQELRYLYEIRILYMIKK